MGNSCFDCKGFKELKPKEDWRNIRGQLCEALDCSRYQSKVWNTSFAWCPLFKPKTNSGNPTKGEK